jgi:hypothetical protein
MKKILNKILCFLGFHTYTEYDFEEHGNYIDADYEHIKEYDECIHCGKKTKF